MPPSNDAYDDHQASDETLAGLYELGAPLDGALSGSIEAVHRKTGVSYALRSYERGAMPASKWAQLSEAMIAQRRISEYEELQGCGSAEEANDAGARITKLHEALRSPTGLVVVSERPPLGGVVSDDLLTLIQRRGRVAEPEARRIFARLVLAVKRVHDCGVAIRGPSPRGSTCGSATANRRAA